MSTTAIGYIRVSTEGQAREGVSLDAQRDRIEAYARAKGLDLTEVLVDEGLSGKTIDRPALRPSLSAAAPAPSGTSSSGSSTA